MTQPAKARVFKNGRSQAVRIPAAFRFKTDEVYIRQNATTGEVTLSEQPVKLSFDEIFKLLDEAGMADFTVERSTEPAVDRDLF